MMVLRGARSGGVAQGLFDKIQLLSSADGVPPHKEGAGSGGVAQILLKIQILSSADDVERWTT